MRYINLLLLLNGAMVMLSDGSMRQHLAEVVALPVTACQVNDLLKKWNKLLNSRPIGCLNCRVRA